MKGGDWPSLNAGNENTVSIILVLLDEVTWSLLGGNSDEGHTFVGRLEPHNLGLVLLSLLLVASIVSVSSLTFGFLFLFRGLTAWTEETQGAREHLASDTFNDCDNMTSVERLLFL
jgi:hypothetical protein